MPHFLLFFLVFNLSECFMCALNNQISAPNLIIYVHKNVRPPTNHTCANVMRDTNCWMIRKPVLKTMIQRTEASMFFFILFVILDSSVKNRFFLSNIPENVLRDIREMSKQENVTISMNVKAPMSLAIWTLKFVTTQRAVINV